MHLTLWVLLPCLTLHSWMIAAVVLDMEAPMTLSWLEGDWSTENQVPETVTEDVESGCICRSKLHQHVVCYGGGTCNVFPKNVTLPPGVADLRVKTTGIAALRAGDLESLTRLEYLEVDANYHLSFVEPGVFRDMSLLKNLSISFNNELRYLNATVFHGLDSLLRIRLIKNGFLHIAHVAPALSPIFLPVLDTLSLSENTFKTITATDFAPLRGTEVRELDLILCQMEYIEPRALSAFKKLEKLRLGENLLTEETLQSLFTEMADEGTPLTLLNLFKLGLRKGPKLTRLLEVIARLSVHHLILTGNHIENLYQGLFPYMPNVTILDLREVSALDVEPNTLSEAVMPRLQTLLLGGNKLPGAVPGVLLPQLSELDLSVNSGNERFQSYFEVNSNNFFQNMTKLTSLNLSFNRIATISNLTFRGVNKLRILGLKDVAIYYIAENSFSMLKELFLLNLEDNPFKPFNKFEELIFQGLENLENLLLGNCKIRYFTRGDIFHSLTRLQYLSLQGNELINIEASWLAPLSSLRGLDLSGNLLRPWGNDTRQFRANSNLAILLLGNNRFTYLTQTMMDDFVGVVRLDLSQNPFVCDCWSFNRTTTWLLTRNLTARETNIFNPGVLCVSPDRWRDKAVTNFIETRGSKCLTELRKGPATNKLLYGTAGVASAILAAVCILCYVYRWYIRYWIFLTKMAYIRHHGWFRRDRKVHPDDCKYDAFVSYSHEDRNFIVRLVAMLENHEPYLKLCVYERDFEIGTVISETVMNKVAASRRTLLVVSDAFARSQWCMWELQIAEYHGVFFKSDGRDDALIMVKLGPIADAHVTPTLRYLMKTRIYLEWNSDVKKQKVFWEKLRNSLSNK